ncbi:MAG: SPASM domain-containing protein [Lachnospiraceae bacterium]|jgi:uncharacterized protein|nr:SPASM domain-containing protein [Lachnospiraceae bacterium]
MIHQYRSNGYNLVLDVNSGAVHVVDDEVYELLPRAKALLDSKGESAQTGALAEIAELYRKGLLFAPDDYADYSDGIKQRPTVVKALCLHVAHACNLACCYCFAEGGGYHGEQALMSLAVGKQALDFLVKASEKRVKLEVDFFGGEPLLNWEVVKELVAYGRSLETPYQKKIRFTLTTNGLLLTEEMFGFINQEMDNVVLSLDGRQEIHDRMRPKRSGGGSYAEIIGKFQALARARKQRAYYVRGTYTRHNLDFSEDARHLAKLGFRHISLEPAILTEAVNATPGQSPCRRGGCYPPVSATSDSPPDYAILPTDLPAICDEYDRLAREVIDRHRAGAPLNFFHFNIDLSGGPCAAKRLKGCGAGSEYLAVAPTGELYPCHQFVGNQEFLVGNVFDGVTAPEVGERLKGVCVYSKPACRECFAKFYCSGGCMANAYKGTGDVNGCEEISCALMQKRLECAIMIKAALN